MTTTPSTPEGWQLVPIEPSHAMMAVLTGEWHSSRHGDMRTRWNVMLASAPLPPPQKNPVHLDSGVGGGVPQSEIERLASVFDAGWRLCVEWARRDDLLADMESKPYMQSRKDAILSVAADGMIQDSIGNAPVPKSETEALNEIVYISGDKRGHVMLQDHCNWLELKLKCINAMALQGLAADVGVKS